MKVRKCASCGAPLGEIAEDAYTGAPVATTPTAPRAPGRAPKGYTR